GVGDIVVQSRGALYSADATIGNQNGSLGTVTLTDLGTRWTVGDSGTTSTLTIGNGVNGHGFLNINNAALVQTTGVVTVNGTGQINLLGGRLRDIGGSTISNGGLIRGDGFIDAAITITAAGELRNAAATANEREYLLVSGVVTSAGTIESIGGEMEFLDTVTNNLEVIARDAILRFLPGGLVNNGDLILGGDTFVHGPISGAGTLTVLPGSTSIVVGDVTFTTSPLIAALDEGGALAAMHSPSSNAISITVGDNPGTLEVIGEVTLGLGTVLDLDFSSSVSSQPGDSFQVLSANNVVGSFANDQAIANGRYWDISYDGDEIFVTANYQLVTTGLGDFDTDGKVDGFDFLAWQRGFGAVFDANDLADWEANYGSSLPVAATGAVPEPSALLLALSALAFGYRRRVA
ncbi:MAG: hypothetical protein IH831_09710, partial [Planctomycetes bacterium]|nr:hypothetical protein [Planctomycetota bacterium]